MTQCWHTTLFENNVQAHPMLFIWNGHDSCTVSAFQQRCDAPCLHVSSSVIISSNTDLMPQVITMMSFCVLTGPLPVCIAFRAGMFCRLLPRYFAALRWDDLQSCALTFSCPEPRCFAVQRCDVSQSYAEIFRILCWDVSQSCAEIFCSPVLRCFADL
jgi:hypothetical protein